MEAQARERTAGPREEYQRKLRERQERQDQGKGPGSGGGHHLKEPSDQPEPKDQVNLTDADSRLMKKGKNGDYQQAYNPQAAVDVEGSMLLVATGLTQCANDLEQLEPMVAAAQAAAGSAELGQVKAVLADTGYASVEALERLARKDEDKDGHPSPPPESPPESPPEPESGTHRGTGVDLYVAVGREKDARRYDYRPRAVLDKPIKEPVDPTLVAMKEKLQTPEGRRIYAKRKQTVEPVFGIIKQAMGFRQFLLRGLAKVTGEWKLVGLAYNFRRLWSLNQMRAG